MSRPLRIEYPGAYYHVMNRALRGQTAFRSEPDFKGFLTLIEDSWRRWDLQVFSYCLMETHYHLAIQTPLGNLQRVMRHIDGVYTQRFNRRYKRDGPLFRGRYKGILIDGDRYLAAVVRYIHLNPVEAKKARRPEEFPWSSHGQYLRPKGAPRWLSLKRVMSRYRSPEAFHKFVLSGNEKALLEFYSKKRRSPVLGDEDFVSRIKDGGYPLSQEHVSYETTMLRPRVSHVIMAVAEAYEVPRDDLFQLRRGERNEARRVAMYLSRELCNLTLKEIAEIFSLGSYGSVGAACSAIEAKLKSDRTLLRRMEKIRGMIATTSSQPKN